MVRGLILGAVAFGAAFAANHQFGTMSKDLERYNRMREMSGDPPFFRQMLKMGTDMLSDFGASRQGEARDMVASLTHDLVRYAQIRSM